jgi:hypothetical protein
MDSNLNLPDEADSPIVTVKFGDDEKLAAKKGRELLDSYLQKPISYRLLLATAERVEVYPLPHLGQVTLGRSPENAVVLQSASISWCHATITMGPVLRIKDLDSRNGVKIGDRLICPGYSEILAPGQSFTLGATVGVIQVAGFIEELLSLFGRRVLKTVRGTSEREKRSRITTGSMKPSSVGMNVRADAHLKSFNVANETGELDTSPPVETASSKGSLLNFLFRNELPQKLWVRVLRLMGEAWGMTALAIYFVNMLGFSQHGVISVFLVSVVLTERFNLLVEENAGLTAKGTLSSTGAHRLTAVSLLALFVGIVCGYLGVVVLQGEDIAYSSYAFVVSQSETELNILTRDFSGLLPRLLNNASVCFGIFIFSLIYRSYGALLTLTWNACHWGLLLAVLTTHGIDASTLSAPIFILVVAIAILPHLLSEAAAYIMSCLCGVQASVLLVGEKDPITSTNTPAMLKLSLGALVLLTLGALLETRFAPAVLSLLSGGS